MKNSNNSIGLKLDTSWFDKESEKYLDSPEFKMVEKITGISIYDLASHNKKTRNAAQDKLVAQSVIANEIQKLHFGFGFPFFIYTQEFNFFEKVKKHNLEIDKYFLSFDMTDSLRRRHIALSHAILPHVISELSEQFKTPLTIKNLGSGVGLDTINAVMHADGHVKKVLNYDTNLQAITLGREITSHLEDEGKIKKNILKYINSSLTNSKEKAHLVIKVGIICGLHNRYAKALLYQAFKSLYTGGKIVVTSSNTHMESTDSLGSFLIQHIGTKEDPMDGWSLNFRDATNMKHLLESVGFKDVTIYDDSNYPKQKNIPEDVLYGVDNLPSLVSGYRNSYKPISLPSRKVLNKKIGYNWIAVAAK